MSDTQAVFSIELDVQGKEESEELASALAGLNAQMKADMAAIKQLESAMKLMNKGTSVNIDGFKALQAQVAAKKATLDQTKEAIFKLGHAAGSGAGFKVAGKAAGAAKEDIEQLGGAFDKIKEGVKGAGIEKGGASVRQLGAAAAETDGPLGNMVRAFGKLKAAGPAGLILAVVGAIVALTVAAIAAVVALARYALAAADAARSQRLLMEAASGGRVAADALATSIDGVAGRVAMTRGKIEELALSLAQSGLQGRALDAALSAVATTSTVMGQAAGSAIQGIADRARQARRFVLGAFDLNGTGLKLADVAGALAQRLNISFAAAQAAIQSGTVRVEDGLEALDAAVQAKFGKIAKAQLLAFNFQVQKAQENVSRIFAGVNVEPFLEALHDVLSVLDQSTITGRALRAIAEIALNPLFHELAELGPIAKAFFQGMVAGTLLLVIAVLKVRNAFRDAFGGDTKSSIDWVKVAMYAGAGLVGALTGLVVLLAAAFLVLAAATAPLWVPFVLLAAAVIGLMMLVASIGEALNGVDLESAAHNMINGLINGIKAGGVAALAEITNLAIGLKDAFKSALGIHSPSKVFAEFGGYTAEGFAQGIEAGGARVDDAVGAMVTTPSKPAATGAGAGQKAGGNTYQIINHFYGRDEDDDLVAKIRQVVTELFEGTAIEMAAPLEPEGT